MGCEESTNYQSAATSTADNDKVSKTYQNTMAELNQICMNSRSITKAHILEITFCVMGRMDRTRYYDSMIVKCINPNIILNILKWHLNEAGKTAQQMDNCKYESYTSPVTNDTVYVIEINNAFKNISNNAFFSHTLINYILQTGDYQMVNKQFSEVIFEYKPKMYNNNNNIAQVVEQKVGGNYGARQNYSKPLETYQ